MCSEEILFDSMLLNQNINSICNRWNKKSNFILPNNFCTYVYSNGKDAFFCKKIPTTTKWRCSEHVNEITSNVEYDVQDSPPYLILFPLKSEKFIDLNTLQIFNKKLEKIGHLHIIDELFYFNPTCNTY